MSVGDRGSIVVGWLTKLVVLFALGGVLAYDGVLLVVANFGVADDAAVAANAASESYTGSKDVRRAYDAAVLAVEGKGDTVEAETFEIDSAGNVTLYVSRSLATLWMHRIGPVKKWTVVRQSGMGAARH